MKRDVWELMNEIDRYLGIIQSVETVMLAGIGAIEALQRIDVGLHEAGLSYEERKGKLTERYHKQNKKHLLSIRPKISASVL